jgi:Bacterial PH domain
VAVLVMRRQLSYETFDSTGWIPRLELMMPKVLQGHALHADVRNIRIRQSLFQRLTRVGEIGISSSGQADIEIFVAGIPNPYDVKSVIDNYRYSDSVVSSNPVQDPKRYQR